MLNLIKKEDFVESVRASMSLDLIKRLTLAPKTSDERVTCVMLSVMVWANKQVAEQHNQLYGYFRHVAEWIQMSYQDHLLSEQEACIVKAHGIDTLLELNASTLKLRNHSCKTSLKPDARPQEAEAYSAISHWKHLVWETTQEARGDHREVLDYLHREIVKDAL